MARTPRITINRWHDGGPEYTIHRRASGWRNRRARRAGAADEVVNPIESHDPLEEGVGAAFLVFAAGEVEVWAFREGHLYRVEAVVDGDVLALLVDAREGDSLQTYRDGIGVLGWEALEGDELEAALAGEVAQPSNVSDGAESQEPVVTLTGAQTEEPALADEDPADEDPADTDTDEESTGDADFDGTVAEFEEMAEAMTDDELRSFVEVDSRKGVREHAARQIEEREIEAKRVADLDDDPED